MYRLQTREIGAVIVKLRPVTCTMIVTLLILSCLGAATTTSDTLTGENVCSKQVGI